VVVNPRQVKNADQAAAALAEALGLSVDQVLAKVRSETSFEYVVRKIEPEKSKTVRALKLDGVYLVEESDRFYPQWVFGCSYPRFCRHR